MKFERLEIKVILYWILIRIVLLFVVSVALVISIVFIPPEYLVIVLIPIGMLFLFAVFFTLILPFLNFRVYKYYIDDEKIIISRGVVFRIYSMVPVIQIQDILTFQGPLQMIFNISSIVISSAGSKKAIWSVNSKKAKDIVEDIQVKIHNRVKNKLKGNEDASL